MSFTALSFCMRYVLCIQSLNSPALYFYRSKEHDHVTESIPSQLWWIQTFGRFSIDDFKPLLPPEDIEASEASNLAHPEKWYPLTMDIFAAFLHKVCSLLLLSVIEFKLSYQLYY